MGYIPGILISSVITAIGIIASFNIPASFLDVAPIGVSLDAITGTTRVSNLDTLLTTNFNNLNDGKIENSTSSVAAITTLANLVSIGTITTGTWNATAVGATYGGTGSTTLSQYQVLAGNGTGVIRTVDGFGTSGQFLTSQGSTNVPQWTTAPVNTATDYTWTGLHTFNGATTTIGSATTTLNGTNPVLAIGTTTPGLKHGLTVATSTYIEGGLGIGIATTSENNLQVVGDVQISGACSGCARISTTTTTALLGTTNGTQTTVTATCPSTSVVIGGGYRRDVKTAGSAHWIVYENNSSTTVRDWVVSSHCVASPCDSQVRMTVTAVCLEKQNWQ